MITKTIKLTEQEAVVLYNNSSDKGFKELLESNFGKNFWKPKDIKDIVYDIDSLMLYSKGRIGMSDEPIILFPNVHTLRQKYLNACSILERVAFIYNEGEVLDWKNTNIYKYIPYKYFDGGGSSVFTAHGCYSSLDTSARLYYKNAKLSDASYKNFKTIWEDCWSFQ